MDASNVTTTVEEHQGQRPDAEAVPRRAWVTPKVERISTSDTQTASNTLIRSDGGINYS